MPWSWVFDLGLSLGVASLVPFVFGILFYFESLIPCVFKFRVDFLCSHLPWLVTPRSSLPLRVCNVLLSFPSLLVCHLSLLSSLSCSLCYFYICITVLSCFRNTLLWLTFLFSFPVERKAIYFLLPPHSLKYLGPTPAIVTSTLFYCPVSFWPSLREANVLIKVKVNCEKFFIPKYTTNVSLIY